MPIDPRKKSDHAPDVTTMIEGVLGCKWTVHVLAQIRAGIQRPGELTRTAKGLTPKVLNERLAKLVRFGILERKSYPEIPPRVEYHLTSFGQRFSKILDEIEKLQQEISTESP